jgi:hypothetical protein
VAAKTSSVNDMPGIPGSLATAFLPLLVPGDHGERRNQGADSSVHSAAGHGALAVECEAGFRRHARRHQACHILPHRWSMLETVT